MHGKRKETDLLGVGSELVSPDFEGREGKKICMDIDIHSSPLAEVAK